MTRAASRSVWRAALLVAATYVYFLIFAEFAFLELARPVTGDGERLRLVMGALGAGGVTGSVLGAWGFSRAAWGRRLATWLLGCVAAAAAALVAPCAGVGGLAGAALAIGVALGGATVCLAAGLRAVAGAERLGLAAGLGTGAAYAWCNLPLVFEASAKAQTAWAMGAALVGAAAAWTWRVPPEEAEENATAAADDVVVARRANNERRGRSVAPWVLVFLALVWMDSAAFYVIQHNEALKAATWRGPWTLIGNAATHFLAAWLAGVVLDRRRAGAVTLVAGGLLAAACLWIERAGAEVSYVAGVSLYSAALVFVPARAGRPRAAAWVFAVAGWGGSALGIGMAQDLRGVPAWFAPVALAGVVAGLAWRHWRRGGAATAGLALAAVFVGAARDGRAADAVDVADVGEVAALARGRAVYVAEGCIHCHSQYVRPSTEDVVRWGPARPLSEMLAEKPPLPGNRRQGPDLANVGNRRTPEWNRLHLLDPRAVSPGSRMPAYARLFAHGERRGDDLVAYLASLGAGTEEARAHTVAEWRPAVEASARANAAAGAVWFARLCANCHGGSGTGDGSLVTRLAGKPADLTRRELDRDEERLARLIKFGRPGTAMAGHEALTDEAVVSLARFVAGLQRADASK